MLFVKTLIELAKEVGCSRQSLYDWKREDVTFPKKEAHGYNVDVVKRWILANDKLTGNNSSPKGKELYTLKCKIAQQDIELNNLEIAEKKRELVNFDEACEICTKALTPLSRRLKDLPSTMCGKCNPSNPTFAKDALKIWLDETLKLVAAQFKKLDRAKRKAD